MCDSATSLVTLGRLSTIFRHQNVWNFKAIFLIALRDGYPNDSRHPRSDRKAMEWGIYRGGILRALTFPLNTLQ